MKKIVVEGWNYGFQKVECTKLIMQDCGLSLSKAKAITDQILENKRVELVLSDNDAEIFTDKMRQLVQELK